MKYRKLLGIAAGIGALCAAAPAAAQGQRYVGQLFLMAGTYCPAGSLDADGRLLSQNGEYYSLFVVIGTAFGGTNGMFNLPDLRGRTAIGAGQGTGLTNHNVGNMGGNNAFPLIEQQMTRHLHGGLIMAAQGQGNSNDPAGKTLAGTPSNMPIYSNSPQKTVGMAPGTVAIGPAGRNEPVTVQSPVLAVRYCISTEGLFPN
ncbi:tail fiber protein [Sphingomonas sp. AOB5]|uniref:phage tail protein n=1 Tax=Sphingomonas sp. AOB5 TaxID=3034017 RepID=UPI0023F9C5B3|nr:tail fiber protein [Sphingomonas sp. AOB5]MDF7775082.1 tail fiber protein [Sphingomonas sp. AOB5]